MEKSKRDSSILNRINLQGRREFDFIAPLSLEDCKKRLKKVSLGQVKFQPDTDEVHFYQIRDAGKNLGIELDAYLAPLDDYQTHVYGNARISGGTTAVLMLFTVTHGGIVALLLSVAAPPLVIVPPAFMVLFWHVCLKARAKLITDLVDTLDVKAKGKLKNKPEAE